MHQVLFGKIDYINLAPFHTFIKRYIKNSQLKQSIEYKKSYPSRINKLFKSRKIDAAFISSIESKRGNFHCLDAGIVAHKEIRSVLLKKGRFQKDSESATSNALAKVLGLEGEVIIGDKALKLFLENPELYTDLAVSWYKHYKLPFVFARFCVNKNQSYYRKLIKHFLHTEVHVPYYLLQRYAKKRDIPLREIKSYLKLVNYNIDYRSKRSLQKFFRS
jgi:chorismate dehydratase